MFGVVTYNTPLETHKCNMLLMIQTHVIPSNVRLHCHQHAELTICAKNRILMSKLGSFTCVQMFAK